MESDYTEVPILAYAASCLAVAMLYLCFRFNGVVSAEPLTDR